MNNIWGFLLFSIAALLALRGFMGAGVRSFLTKNERKKYHASTSRIDRWFFWSVPNLISDRYSKSEKRRISYASTLKAYRAINLAAHIGLLQSAILPGTLVSGFSIPFVLLMQLSFC